MLLLPFATRSVIGAENGGDSLTNLADLSLEELVNIQITSVSKKETPLLRSPAAVAVLTGEDIRHLGANSIPDALRAVPGLDVARISANKWAVSARGLNDEFANKLLVLVDGRSVYTPTFGGVYWDSVDVVMEDLDRIEVIRGPGATLWGANAVNGVINIITKSAKETQGLLSSAEYGTENQPQVTTRFGGKLASNLFYRVYVKYFDREEFEDAQGTGMGDDWNMTRGGVRLDWEPGDQDTFTLLGDYYDGSFGENVGKTSVYPTDYRLLNVRAPESGGNVLGRWTHTFSDESELQLQVYFDQYCRRVPFGGGVLIADANTFDDSRNAPSDRRNTWDVDLQHRFKLGRRNDVVWGLGYRITRDNLASDGSAVQINTPQREDNLFSAFLQDEITLVNDRLWLTIGSKFEHNDYTGFEVEPGGRLLWTPSEHQTFWASITRAVRTPTRLEQDWRVDLLTFLAPDGSGTPVLTSAIGNPDARSEEELAYEIGWRFQPIPRVSLDVTMFYNDYSLLESVPGSYRAEMTPSPAHLLVPYDFKNGVACQTYGTELLVHWQATERWRFTAGYSWLHAWTPDDLLIARSSPEQQCQLRSSLNLGRGWEVDAAAYYVDQVQVTPQVSGETTIPGYVRLDLGLSWKPCDHVQISVWGQNLLDDGHPEFGSYKTPDLIEVPRTFYGKITCWF